MWANKKHFLDVVLMDFFLVRSYLLGFSPLWKSLWIFKTVVAVKFYFHNLFIICIGKAFTHRMFLVPLRCEKAYGSSMFVFTQCMHWFPLKAFIVEFTYRRPFSSVEKLMNLQEGGFGLIFVTNSSMSALLGP